MSDPLSDTPPNPRFPIFTRGNAAEVMPNPVSPLSWTYLWSRSLIHGQIDAYVGVGVMSADELNHVDDLYGLYDGYFYVNLSNVRTYGARLASAEAADRNIVGERSDAPPYEPHPQDLDPDRVAKAQKGMERALSWTHVPYVDGEREQARAARQQRPDLTTLSESQLLARADLLRFLGRRSFMSTSVVGAMAAVPASMLQGAYQAIGETDRTIELLGGLGEIDSVLPSIALWDLSRQVREASALSAAFDQGVDGLIDRLRSNDDSASVTFVQSFEDFLQEFGSRGPVEWDLASPVWETHPVLALRHVDNLRKSANSESPADRNAAVKRSRDELVEVLEAKVRSNPELHQSVQTGVRTAKMWLEARERTKTSAIQVVHEIRMVFAELGRRAQERQIIPDARHVWMLQADELQDFLRDGLSWTSTLAARWRTYQDRFDLEPPFFIDSRQPRTARSKSTPVTASTKVAVRSGQVLSGIPGSVGVARGRARLVTDPFEDSKLEPGDILIAKSTDPSWTPLFYLAGAIVVSLGGVNSHAVIVGRELGVPCVVSVADCLSIPDGADITVDGLAGTVAVH